MLVAQGISVKKAKKMLNVSASDYRAMRTKGKALFANREEYRNYASHTLDS